jgi:cell division protein ZipA
LLRLAVWQRPAKENPEPAKANLAKTSPAKTRNETPPQEPEFDPLFAVDFKKETVSDTALADLGKIVAEQEEPQVAHVSSSSQAAAPGEEAQGVQQAPPKPSVKRRSPRVADDPHRVVVLNVMARQDRSFAGGEVRNAVEGAGFEYGDWQIFHYYPPRHGDNPPSFSLANMVKPGSFDLENMDTLSTAGLSLFMVSAGDEDDIANFDTMLATSRRLAAELGGEVRDARRSVLTRQAIAQIREQLNELRCKTQVAQH